MRNNNSALHTDANYKKLRSSNEAAVFAFVREKDGNKAVVVINFSANPQQFQVKDSIINGEPLNLFMGVKEKISDTHTFNIEPWGFSVYDYQ
jgi:glycosidase